MKIRVIINKILTIIMVLLMATTVSGKTLYVDNRTGLNLREQPSLEATILDKLELGTECDLIKTPSLKGSGWRKIRVANQVGYVQIKYLSKANPLDQYEYAGNWMLTAYTHTGSACANGNYPTAGYTTACNSLPFGTEVFISGVGFRTVEDRGPGHLGSEWLDLFMDDYSSCVNFGIQYHDVYVVSYE